MKRILLFGIVLCMLLSGCSWMGGSYVSVTPHQEQRVNTQTAVISASNYLQLTDALTDMIAEGTESAAINVSEYPPETVENGMKVAIGRAMKNDPIGAYAVEKIEYDLGTSAGQPALAVKIQYRHSRVEIKRMDHIEHMDEVQPIVKQALRNYDTSAAMLVENYQEIDFGQIVAELVRDDPQNVMEVPQVSVETYGSGSRKVVELKFTYTTNRETLRQMQSQVKPVFDAAVLYVKGGTSDGQKFSQLYSFLMERFEYRLESSITPTYSLLHQGIGDSSAFATVYAAMCRAAGLECLVVIGTYENEPRAWNIVLDNGYYYHVDLLQCSERGRYVERTDRQMSGYSWDQGVYPVCAGVPGEAVEIEETKEK